MYQHRQSMHAFSHIGIATSQIDPYIRLQRDHRRANAASTRRSAPLSTRASTRTLTPSGRAISIIPSVWLIATDVAVTFGVGGVAGAKSVGMATTSTRANFAPGCTVA